MKKRVATTLLAGALIAAYGFPAQAQTAASTPTSAIVYANGANSTFDDAIADLQILKRELGAHDKTVTYVYGNAYNASSNIFRDLWQVFRQKSLEGSSAADFWRALDGKGLPEEGMNAELQQKYVDLLADNNVPELLEHLDKYRAYLKEQRRIVVVGHSQGSLYANFAVNLLATGPEKAQGRISAVNVGSATRYQLPGSSYLTSTSDYTIRMLGRLSPVLPANFSMSRQFWTDPTGHSFSRIYMNRRFGAANQILRQISQQAASAT